jgi:hypothetical protein
MIKVEYNNDKGTIKMPPTFSEKLNKYVCSKIENDFNSINIIELKFITVSIDLNSCFEDKKSGICGFKSCSIDIYQYFPRRLFSFEVFWHGVITSELSFSEIEIINLNKYPSVEKIKELLYSWSNFQKGHKILRTKYFDDNQYLFKFREGIYLQDKIENRKEREYFITIEYPKKNQAMLFDFMNQLNKVYEKERQMKLHNSFKFDENYGKKVLYVIDLIDNKMVIDKISFILSKLSTSELGIKSVIIS